MLFIWFTRVTALSFLFSLFASPLFLIFYYRRLHAQPLPFSLSIEINFLTLSCPSLLCRVCLWQLGWVLIGFTMVRSVLWWGFVCLIDFFFFFFFEMVAGRWMGFVASGLWWFVAVVFFFLFSFFGFRWWWLVVASGGCGCGFARLRAFVHPDPFVWERVP